MQIATRRLQLIHRSHRRQAPHAFGDLLVAQNREAEQPAEAREKLRILDSSPSH